MTSLYMSTTWNLLSLRLGPSSPPSTENSLGSTVNLFTLATLEMARVLALSTPAWMAASTTGQEELASSSWMEEVMEGEDLYGRPVATTKARDPGNRPRVEDVGGNQGDWIHRHLVSEG